MLDNDGVKEVKSNVFGINKHGLYESKVLKNLSEESKKLERLSDTLLLAKGIDPKRTKELHACRGS